MNRYNLIFVFGGPASGKGTLCARLIRQFDSFVHVSPGDLVRAKTDLDPEMSNLMKNGQLLPTPFIGNLIWSHISQNFTSDKTILLDGFPRNLENFDYYQSQMRDNFNLIAAIVLDCDDDIMLERTVGRAKVQGRKDDTIEVCKERIKIYRGQTEKILELVDPKLIKKIYSGGPVEDTYTQTFKILLDVIPF